MARYLRERKGWEERDSCRDRDGVSYGGKKEKMVKRHGRVREDEEDERRMRFLFLSRAFITSMGFILVVSLSLLLSTVLTPIV